MGRNLSKSDIPTLVLSVLAEGACHGYAIAREVERRSKDLFRLREGSLYPALRVLEQEKFIVGEWDTQGGGAARKVYRLTAEGQAELASRTRDWAEYSQAINSFIGGTHAPTY
jgi:PadR family transcriptional regulator PadR